LGIRKRLFEELAGFDLAFPVNFNDADLCLRARQLGYEVIYEPAAVLRHYECSTRTPGILYEERERWNDRWGTVLERGDSYYSPNLTRTREDASLNMEKQPAAPSPPATAAARG
jgi:GT2 family glycosyltransferase